MENNKVNFSAENSTSSSSSSSSSSSAAAASSASQQNPSQENTGNTAGNKTPVQKIPEKEPDSNFFMKYLPEIVSALGSLGGSYMLWAKPLQERMDNMSRQISELQDKVHDLLRENRHLQKRLDGAHQPNNNGSDSPEYLPSKRTPSYMRRI